jgi:hypothetical protein
MIPRGYISPISDELDSNLAPFSSRQTHPYLFSNSSLSSQIITHCPSNSITVFEQDIRYTTKSKAMASKDTEFIVIFQQGRPVRPHGEVQASEINRQSLYTLNCKLNFCAILVRHYRFPGCIATWNKEAGEKKPFIYLDAPLDSPVLPAYGLEIDPEEMSDDPSGTYGRMNVPKHNWILYDIIEHISKSIRFLARRVRDTNGMLKMMQRVRDNARYINVRFLIKQRHWAGTTIHFPTGERVIKLALGNGLKVVFPRNIDEDWYLDFDIEVPSENWPPPDKDLLMWPGIYGHDSSDNSSNDDSDDTISDHTYPDTDDYESVFFDSDDDDDDSPYPGDNSSPIAADKDKTSCTVAQSGSSPTDSDATIEDTSPAGIATSTTSAESSAASEDAGASTEDSTFEDLQNLAAADAADSMNDSNQTQQTAFTTETSYYGPYAFSQNDDAPMELANPPNTPVLAPVSDINSEWTPILSI